VPILIGVLTIDLFYLRLCCQKDPSKSY